MDELNGATRAAEEKEKRHLVEEARSREAAPAPPPPPTPSPGQAAEGLKSAAAYYLLYVMGGPSGTDLRHDLAAQQAHLESFLAEGSPADPVERLLLQQLFLAHHAAGGMHARAGTATNQQAVVAFSGAAARLIAEVRRLALALEVYRDSAARRKAKKPAEATKRAASRAAANGRGSERERNGSETNGAEVGSNDRLKGYFDALDPARS